MKKIKSLDANHYTVIVRFDMEWEEYTVDVWRHSSQRWVHDATYYTSELDDAIDTAKAMATIYTLKGE